MYVMLSGGRRSKNYTISGVLCFERVVLPRCSTVVGLEFPVLLIGLIL